MTCVSSHRIAAGQPSRSGESDRPVPHFELSSQPAEYSGPGREEPPPADVREVLIAWFGPSDPNHAEGGGAWIAAGIAIDEANVSGGYRGSGIPFRLVPVWSDNPWVGGAGSLARLASSRDVWAIIGSIDGPSSHLAEQVAVKARITFVNSSSTDRTVNLANVPWVFSIPPPDDLLASVLAAHVVGSRRGKPLAIVSATDHDSRVATTDLMAALEAAGLAPLHHLEFDPTGTDRRALADHLSALSVSAAVIVAGASDSARILAAIREKAPELTVFGGPSMGRSTFLKEAGPAADGVVFPLTCDPEAAPSEPIAAFRAQADGEEPDCNSLHAYDAVRLVIEAIQRAGLNRARIRDAVRDLSPWPGASGPILWDNLNANDHPVRLATFRSGVVAPL